MIFNQNINVLAVDDDELNLEIINTKLKSSDINCTSFLDPNKALNYIIENPNYFNVILLDKLMPKLNGIEMLQKLKQNTALKNIPVIIQTCDIGHDNAQDAINKGAYYYLEKPFSVQLMLSLIQSAANEYSKNYHYIEEAKQNQTYTKFMKKGEFKVKTIEDAENLAMAVSYNATNATNINIAIKELLFNSIEHGLLNIGYDKKHDLLMENRFIQEIEYRFKLEKNKNKYIQVYLEKQQNRTQLIIEDFGKGFDWKPYLKFSIKRATSPNGRGIASAIEMGLEIEYIKPGNIVKCSWQTKE